MSIYRTPEPVNEPIKSYAPGSPERATLKKCLGAMQGDCVEIPMIIGGRRVTTGKLAEIRPPHDHRSVVGRHHQGDASHVDQAIAAAAEASPAWRELPWEQRAAVFLKAADLLAGPWRDRLNASTMIGQSKNAFQAEIDAACEMIDFFRFNARFAQDVYAEQPISSAGCWNRLQQRALEGFVFAVTPFNFTSIGGNLPTSAALMGNTVVWKPASTSVLSAHYTMELLEAAGLPPGVINIVYGSGSKIGPAAIASPALAGVHFTGSTDVFQGMWREIGSNIQRYKSYPRIVGETGGKDFIFAHPSADIDGLAVAMARGAFEYQGQKCSAASRAYVPKSIWPAVKSKVQAMLAEMRMGPVDDFSNFINAVIDASSFKKLSGAIEAAKSAASCTIVAGGEYDDSEGYFIKPCVIETTDAKWRTMCEELFGPILTVYPYDDAAFEETLGLCDTTSPYALTGAIFAQDRHVIEHMSRRLSNAAGNFYINDKPTGAVVGQQPFGGARASGTNDKAGSKLNLQRWVNPRTIKETFVPASEWSYPFLAED
ncbi:MAG: L-glutamate gamma-semialdehyde dehydrogenase [Planctomycetes bacterium]|nr:L-glutamate gamma-semialdehyde dehydrogenase [Planctomycetota bacterium]